MNKKELVEAVAKANELTKKDSEKIIDSVFESITQAMQSGEKVMVSGFGTFEVRARAARKGIAPKTKQPIDIPASNAPVFKASKALKEAMN